MTRVLAPSPVSRSRMLFFSSCPWLALCGLRIIAQSTGVSVRATMPERMIVEAMVTPNWR